VSPTLAQRMHYGTVARAIAFTSSKEASMLVRFYAVGRELAEVDEVRLAVSTFAELAAELQLRFGSRMTDLAAASTLLLDGTRHRISDDVVLTETDVVDLLPPFAGG
jgi:molybdopterin converting factor small subunit